MPAEPAGKPPASDLGIGEIAQLARQALGFGLRAGDHRAEARQDQCLVRGASFGHHQRLEIGVEGLGRRFFHLRGEDRLGMPGGEAAAGLGGAGLHEDRPALRSARHVERPRHGIVLAVVVDRLDTQWIGIVAIDAVIQHRVVGPAVPQTLHHLDIFFAAGVAVGMAHLAVAPVVARRGGEP